MDFAADAVAEVMAPTPPRAGARGNDARDDNAFAQHLEAAERCATHETPPPEKTDRCATDEPAPDKSAETAAPEQSPRCAEPAADAPKPQPPSPPTLLSLGAVILNLTATRTAAGDVAAVAASIRDLLSSAAPTPVDQTAAGAAEGEATGVRSCAASDVITPGKSAEPATHEPKTAEGKQAAPALQANAAAAQTPALTPTAPEPALPAPNATAQGTPPAAPATTAQAARPSDSRMAPRAGKADVARSAIKSDAAAAKADGNVGAAKPQGRSAPTIASEGVVFALVDAPETTAANPQTTTGGLSFSATHTAQAQHAVLDQGAARAAPVAAQVAREIVRRFDGENTRFEVRLDPPELGRVDVRLEVSRDHRVTAVVSADSPQALTELARHARELEQSLQSAGLQLADNGLSFDLRQSSDDAEQTGGDADRSTDARADDVSAEAPLMARPLGLERWRGVRVDVMV